MNSIKKIFQITVLLMGTNIPYFSQNISDTLILNKKLSVDEFENKLNSDSSIQLIDVRTPDEFVSGHLKGAKNIDFYSKDFVAQIIKLDKNKKSLVYCLGGSRSKKALEIMMHNGFGNVYYLDGGIMKWRINNKPIIESTIPLVTKGMSEDEYKVAVKKDKLVLVDFYATWCPPCKGMVPVLEQISEELKDRVEVLRIIFDENKYLAKYLKIESFTTFFIYKNGVQVWRGEGAMEKSALQLIISKY